MDRAPFEKCGAEFGVCLIFWGERTLERAPLKDKLTLYIPCFNESMVFLLGKLQPFKSSKWSTKGVPKVRKLIYNIQ